jgi:hypothetical protein
MVDAPVEDVARLFKERIGARIWKKDTLAKKVTLTRRCYAVTKLVGQKWTSIIRVRSGTGEYPSAADAQFLSKALGTRAMHVAVGDTAGTAEYVLFDEGRVEELFSEDALLERPRTAAAIERTKGIDLDRLKLEVRGARVFGSRRRKVKVSTIKNPYQFVSDFVAGEDALAPLFGDDFPGAGQATRIEFELLREDEIERLDFVAM